MLIHRDQAAIAALRAKKLSQSRAEAGIRIVQEIDRVTVRITGVVPEAEMLAWASKEAAARALLERTGTAEQLSILTGEAQETGEDIADLARRIIGNADAYRDIIARLTGLRRKAASVIAVLETEEEIAAVVQETLAALAREFAPG